MSRRVTAIAALAVLGAVPSAAAPAWEPVVRTLSTEERAAMTGVSWREGCPVHLDDLRVLELPHHTLDGGQARGQLIVHHDSADKVVTAFKGLFDASFAIVQMRPVREFEGSDTLSMKADNTSAFNCRPVLGGSSWSQHSYGRAIDINPLRNPYVRGKKVDPPEGRAWLDRSSGAAGVIGPDSPAIAAFRAIGWKWGGNWSSSKDYQHFSANGR
ncbi:MAG: M15 family metallopeptidase [Myxococcota bacterium]